MEKFLEIPFNSEEETGIKALETVLMSDPKTQKTNGELSSTKKGSAGTEAQNQFPQNVTDRTYFSSLQHYLTEIGKIPLLSREDEITLAHRIANNDEQARRQMILANLRLVVSIAKNYQRGNIALMDLVEEGNLGLIHAVHKFKPEYGCRFSTYATAWIKQAILRSLSEHGRMIRIPLHMVELIKKYFRVTRQLRMELDRDPTFDDIAEVMGISRKQIEFIASMLKGVTSMDQALGNNSTAELHESIPDESIEYPDEMMDRKLKNTALLEFLDSLPEQEKTILQFRFGFIDGAPQTLAQIGQQLGLSRERIRQIEQKALSRLKHRMVYNSLNELFAYT